MKGTIKKLEGHVKYIILKSHFHPNLTQKELKNNFSINTH